MREKGACHNYIIVSSQELRTDENFNFGSSISTQKAVWIFHGQGGVCDRSHCNASRCPFITASGQVISSHGHGGVCDRSQCNISSWPFAAAAALHDYGFHRPGGHGGVADRSHCNTSSWPAPAACAHVRRCHLGSMSSVLCFCTVENTIAFFRSHPSARATRSRKKDLPVEVLCSYDTTVCVSNSLGPIWWA